MIVCHCLAVREQEIRQCGAKSLAEVSAKTGAGTDCEGCHEAIRGILESLNAYKKTERDR